MLNKNKGIKFLAIDAYIKKITFEAIFYFYQNVKDKWLKKENMMIAD